MAENISGVGQRGYSCTYWHLGRKAASMMAPEASKTFPLKSALVMDVSMVTASLLLESPLMVSLFNALMVVWTVQVLAECITGMDGAWRARFGNCDSRVSQCTHLHSGIAAAMCLAPSSPMLLLLISKLASVPLHVVVL